MEGSWYSCCVSSSDSSGLGLFSREFFPVSAKKGWETGAG